MLPALLTHVFLMRSNNRDSPATHHGSHKSLRVHASPTKGGWASHVVTPTDRMLRPDLRIQLDHRKYLLFALLFLSLRQYRVLEVTQGQGHDLPFLLSLRIWGLAYCLCLWNSQLQPRPFYQGPDTETHLPNLAQLTASLSHKR